MVISLGDSKLSIQIRIPVIWLFASPNTVLFQCLLGIETFFEDFNSKLNGCLSCFIFSFLCHLIYIYQFSFYLYSFRMFIRNRQLEL